MLFLRRDQLDLLRDYLSADAVVVDQRHGEVQEVVAMRSDIERAF